MDGRRRAKDGTGSRRERRQASRRERARLRVFPGPRVGPGMTVASPAEVAAALERFDPHLPWAEVRDVLVPMFERRRPFPPGMPEPLTLVLPPGVSVGFGIDLGPALARVSPDLVADWGVTAEEVARTAIANVRRAAAGRDLPAPVEGEDALAGVRAFQSRDGWASAILLDPPTLERVFGAAPAILTAPMRDVVLAFPPDTDLDDVLATTEAFEELDPNALALEAFAWGGGKLSCVPLRAAARA